MATAISSASRPNSPGHVSSTPDSMDLATPSMAVDHGAAGTPRERELALEGAALVVLLTPQLEPGVGVPGDDPAALAVELERPGPASARRS